jgi:hypothetical protein
VELPASLGVADQAAIRAQRATRRIYAVELISVVVAAAAGIAAWRVGEQDLDVLAAVATVGFAAALAAGFVRTMRHQQTDWVKARAAAEAIRAAAWRYAVGGTPFGPGEAAPDAVLLGHVREAMATLADVTLPVPATTTAEISADMRALRAAPLGERKDAYRAGRLDDQIDYYRRQSRRSDQARRRWFAVGTVANLAGVTGGLLRFAGVIDVDVVGVAAAVAGAAVAWTQLNQHRTLSTAYAQTLWQLSLARTQHEAVPEDEWPEYVDSVEDVMAREHSVWLRKRAAAPPGADS